LPCPSAPLCCSPVPGFISRTIFSDSIQPGWNWLPYNARNSVLLARDQGVDSSVATCTTLSRGGAVNFQCRQCSRAGYQPFARAESLRFDIRSNTQSDDEFASSTPRGELPGIKLFLMNVSGGCYPDMLGPFQYRGSARFQIAVLPRAYGSSVQVILTSWQHAHAVPGSRCCCCCCILLPPVTTCAACS
jgi:hypothetical protein